MWWDKTNIVLFYKLLTSSTAAAEGLARSMLTQTCRHACKRQVLSCNNLELVFEVQLYWPINEMKHLFTIWLIVLVLAKHQCNWMDFTDRKIDLFNMKTIFEDFEFVLMKDNNQNLRWCR